jgi:hypothetical protein
VNRYQSLAYLGIRPQNPSVTGERPRLPTDVHFTRHKADPASPVPGFSPCFGYTCRIFPILSVADVYSRFRPNKENAMTRTRTALVCIMLAALYGWTLLPAAFAQTVNKGSCDRALLPLKIEIQYCNVRFHSINNSMAATWRRSPIWGCWYAVPKAGERPRGFLPCRASLSVRFPEKLRDFTFSGCPAAMSLLVRENQRSER